MNVLAAAASKPDPGASLAMLTPAERVVAQRVMEGLSNKEIARELGKATGTVKNQLVSIFRKLGVRNRIRLVVLLRP